MKKILITLSVVILLCLGLALNVHIVQLDESTRFLQKTEMTFEDTFVDARGANKFKLLAKPRLIEAGIKDLMED